MLRNQLWYYPNFRQLWDVAFADINQEMREIRSKTSAEFWDIQSSNRWTGGENIDPCHKGESYKTWFTCSGFDQCRKDSPLRIYSQTLALIKLMVWIHTIYVAASRKKKPCWIFKLIWTWADSAFMAPSRSKYNFFQEAFTVSSLEKISSLLRKDGMCNPKQMQEQAIVYTVIENNKQCDL